VRNRRRAEFAWFLLIGVTRGRLIRGATKRLGRFHAVGLKNVWIDLVEAKWRYEIKRFAVDALSNRCGKGRTRESACDDDNQRALPKTTQLARPYACHSGQILCLVAMVWQAFDENTPHQALRIDAQLYSICAAKMCRSGTAEKS